MSKQDVEPPRVIAIEDNPADARLAREGVKTVETELDFQVHNSGAEAIERLKAIDPEPQAAHPDLILLDLNLPGKSGFEVLTAIRTETAFQHVPVVVVSSSENRSDIRRVYELSGNAYVVKPVDPDEYIEMIGAIVDFWTLNATGAYHD